MPADPVSDREAEALFAPLEGAPRVLAAVSGGPDSMAMLALLGPWARRAARPALAIACVDHGLRPEAALEAELVAREAARHALPFVKLDLPRANLRKGRQDHARVARYAALAAHAQAIGASHVVTAHHLDDQAETILMRLAAGSGVRGLAGMAALRPLAPGVTLARPLIAIPRARLFATCAARAASHAADPSNDDPRYRRTRWRALMPALAAEGLTPARLALFARRLARIEAALEDDAARLLAGARLPGPPGMLRLDAGLLAQAGPERTRRVLHAALAQLDWRAGTPKEAPLARAERLADDLVAAARSGARLRRTLGGALVALDGAGTLQLEPEAPRRRGTSRPRGADMAAAASVSLGNGPAHP